MEMDNDGEGSIVSYAEAIAIMEAFAKNPTTVRETMDFVVDHIHRNDQGVFLSDIPDGHIITLSNGEKVKLDITVNVLDNSCAHEQKKVKKKNKIKNFFNKILCRS